MTLMTFCEIKDVHIISNIMFCLRFYIHELVCEEDNATITLQSLYNERTYIVNTRKLDLSIGRAESGPKQLIR